MDLKHGKVNWVIDKYYYIINFEYFLRPRVYPVYFVNKRAAKRAIRLHEPSTKYQRYYEVIRGKKLKEFKTTHVLRLGRLGTFTKYPYPKRLNTIQKRKSFRTQMRRRLRRMGMLTEVKSKGRVGQKPGIVKLKPNKQWVANTPYTTSICFALERKPKQHFVILEKRLSQRKGYLFEVKVLKLRKQEPIKTITLRIQRKDIITPFLLTEITQMYGNRVFKRLRKENIRLDHPKQKAVFTLHAKRVA